MMAQFTIESFFDRYSRSQDYQVVFSSYGKGDVACDYVRHAHTRTNSEPCERISINAPAPFDP